MTFAPIHDFVPRKFPQTLSSTPGVGPDWQKLPAFMVDRESNQNKWLTDIFGSNNEIPIGTNSSGEPQIAPLTLAPPVALQGAANINNINVPINIPPPNLQ
jgi:hypothetical protein